MQTPPRDCYIICGTQCKRKTQNTPYSKITNSKGSRRLKPSRGPSKCRAPECTASPRRRAEGNSPPSTIPPESLGESGREKNPKKEEKTKKEHKGKVSAHEAEKPELFWFLTGKHTPLLSVGIRIRIHQNLTAILVKDSALSHLNACRGELVPRLCLRGRGPGSGDHGTPHGDSPPRALVAKKADHGKFHF